MPSIRQMIWRAAGNPAVVIRTCWQVVDDLDGEVMQDDLPTKEAAEAAVAALEG